MNGETTINVIGSDYAYGLSQDGRIVTRLLNEAGFNAVFVNAEFPHEGSPWAETRAKVLSECRGLGYRFQAKRDLNVFLERIPRHMFAAARRHVLVPNQEWFLAKKKKYLGKFDLVVCKTRHAAEIFSGLGCRTAFSSFTSVDHGAMTGQPKRREFLMVLGNRRHIAGRVLDVWARHPEWPRLVVLGRNMPEGVDLPNVTLLREFISEEEIVHLQNSSLFHLCVTAAEGFGHKLNEAMSCGAIAIATDAPPMNEIVQPDRGYLVKWSRSNPMELGTEFHFDEADLERTVEKCLQITPPEIATLSANARAWFEQNDRFFRNEFVQVLRQMIGGAEPVPEIVPELIAGAACTGEVAPSVFAKL